MWPVHSFPQSWRSHPVIAPVAGRPASRWGGANLLELAPPATDPGLTQRERDCILMVACGQSDAEIAQALGLQATTVATHVKHARVKLVARTRAQAVAKLLMFLVRPHPG